MKRILNVTDNLTKLAIFIGIFIFSLTAFAMNGKTTYQAKIIKPDGYPLEATSVNFRFTVLDTSGSCALYVEDYAAVNMSGTGGLISFALGSGTRSFPASGTSMTFRNVFENFGSFPCRAPNLTVGSYGPGVDDARKIVMQFQDTSGWQTLPAMAINAVPYAMYAHKANSSLDSGQLNGKTDAAFVEYSALAALNCNPATHAITVNNLGSFSCIPVGSSSSGITSVTTSGTVLLTGGTASAPVISIQAATMSQDGYLTSLDYAEFKAKLSASSTQIVNTLGYTPVSFSTVASQIASSTLAGDVSGNPGSNTVDIVGGKSASQISTSVNDTLAATASNTADTIVKRNSSGNFTANDIYANAAKINYVDIYKPLTSFSIRLQAPTSLSTNYVLNLPTTSGTTGQVLSTDGSGNLSWISPTTGSVVSVSATAPLASTGGSNPTISITQSSSSTDGYLSSSDFTTFSNKQNATSAAIIATLGYTPADNAASGTYAQKANNLSDLTNIPQARSNLGLGTFATASSIDLGSASATGIIADARLADQSNVASGTEYTKVTVDGKGRVVSGAQLSSLDVTTALGYTPATSTTLAASFVQKTGDTMTGALNLPSNGLAVGTNQFIVSGSNVGIGVLSPEAALHLKAGTTSNAPLKFTSGTLLSSAQSGTIEYDGSQLYFTDGLNARRAIATNSTPGSFDNTSSISNSSGNITLSPNNITGSVIVNSSAASISSGTGALVVNGGLGVAGSINAGGNLNLTGSATIGQSLQLSSMASGSLLFAGASGLVSEDNSRLFWDGANKRLGIGSNAPTSTLSVSGTGYFSGNVGIGTSLPTTPLEVKNSIIDVSSTVLRLTSADGGFAAGQESQIDFNQNSTLVAKMGMTYFAPDWGFNFYGYNSTLNTTPIMTMRGNGNVGIGTTAPRQKLDVVGVAESASGTAPKGAFVLGAASTNGVLNMGVANPGTFYSWIQSRHASSANYYNLSLNPEGGNVGVGTNTPSALLHLSSATSGDAELLLEADTDDNNEGDNPFIHFVQDSGLIHGYLGFSGNANEAFNLTVSDVATNSLVLNSASSPIFLATSNTARLAIATSGNVGIGTTSPSSNLQVGGAGSATSSPSTISMGSTYSDTQGAYPKLKIWDNGNMYYGFGVTSSQLELIASQTSGRIAMFTGGSSAPAVLITSSGNVGIGTTAPTSKLEVGVATLGGNLNDVIEMQRLSGSNGNANILDIREVRTSAGSDWTTGATRIQQKVDSTWMAYLQFNGAGNNGGLSLGVGTTTTAPGNTTEALRITSSGNVGIGTTTPGYKLDVSGTINIASGSALAFGGTSVCTAAGCTSSSDERLKENIKPLDFNLNKLLSLNAVQYDWKNKSKYGDKHQIGFIAQKLEQVYPEVVYTDKNTGLKSVAYGNLVAPVIEALKSIYNRLLGLESRIDRQIASIVESKADKTEIELLKARDLAKSKEIEAVKAENSALKAYLCGKDPSASICK